MSITVVKENGTLRILEASSDIPEGIPVRFVGASNDASLAAFVRGEEQDSAAELFPVT